MKTWRDAWIEARTWFESPDRKGNAYAFYINDLQLILAALQELHDRDALHSEGSTQTPRNSEGYMTIERLRGRVELLEEHADRRDELEARVERLEAWQKNATRFDAQVDALFEQCERRLGEAEKHAATAVSDASWAKGNVEALVEGMTKAWEKIEALEDRLRGAESAWVDVDKLNVARIDALESRAKPWGDVSRIQALEAEASRSADRLKALESQVAKLERSTADDGHDTHCKQCGSPIETDWCGACR